MTKFIKLTNTIINISKISKIEIYPKIYHIYTNDFNFGGTFIITIGWFSGNNTPIRIRQEENPIDYEKITDFINKLD